jgi:membrane associated rhomboid family serine protease
MSRMGFGANPLHQLPSGLRALLIANVGVFILQIALPYVALEKLFALHPLQSGEVFYPWQIVTYSFLHGNGFHLFINMWILWMFGGPLESWLGTKQFLIYYFICVIGAGLCHMLLVPTASAVGASGGIYGLLIAFGLIYPDVIMYLFFVLPMKAIHAVWFIGLLALASAIGSGGSRVAHMAHLGGMATGFLYFKLPVWFRSLRSLRSRRPRFHVIEPDRPARRAEHDDLKNQVDRILEKISAHGIESLTDEEHEIMRAYAKKNK